MMMRGDGAWCRAWCGAWCGAWCRAWCGAWCGAWCRCRGCVMYWWLTTTRFSLVRSSV